MVFAQPRENALSLGLKEGMKVADLGSGPGHYALALSPVVGDEGTVYAIDIQEDVLRALRSEAQSRGYTNLVTVWGDIEKAGGTKLRDGAVDAVVLSNILFQVSHKNDVVAEVRRILRTGGRVLVIDWAGSYEGMGPAVEHVVSERDAEELFIGAGFHKTWSKRAGPHHYSILFTAP